MSLEHTFAELLGRLTPDAKRPGLLETPRRMTDAWRFWMSGYQQDPKKVLKDFSDGSENYDEMIFQGGINFFSTCEHHLIPFFGVVHIGYVAHGKIVGLSKLARLVEIFARRLQVQERMTTQIADAFMDIVKPSGVGVVTQARHLCIESRGIQKAGTITTTSALRGAFKDHAAARSEFLSFVQASSWTGK